VFPGGAPELVTDHARLDPRRPRPGVQAHDLVHVLGEIERHGRVHALARQPGAAAPDQYRHLMLAAHLQRGQHIPGVERDDHPDRDLPVDRGVIGVERL